MLHSTAVATVYSAATLSAVASVTVASTYPHSNLKGTSTCSHSGTVLYNI